jgi:pimeloyl-ACP methyl ester carboxylesterase
MTIVIQWALGILIALGVLKLLVLWLQPRLAFYPVPGPTPAPPPFSAFEVQTSDGVRITGWRTDIPAGRPVLLYFCGNAGNLADRTELLTGFAHQDCAVVAFNYRGTGESGGRPSEAGVYRDAAAVCDYLTHELDVEPGRIVLWGHSIGGAIATHLAIRRDCAGLVLESTFRSAKVMAGRIMPLLPLGWFLSYRLDNEGNIPKTECPILFIHGTLDPVVPIDDSRRLHALAEAPADIWIIEGAGHNDNYVLAGEEFYRRICAFAASATGRQSPP